MNIIEQQPAFPQEDLSPKNARFIKDLLEQPDLLYIISPENLNGHLEEHLRQFDLSDTTTAIQASHRLLERVGETEHLIHPHQRTNITYGYTLYEIITGLVVPPKLLPEIVPVTIAAHSLAEAIRHKSIDAFIEGSIKRLINEQPNATELIAQSAERAASLSAEQALRGAAIRRQLELSNREYVSSLNR